MKPDRNCAECGKPFYSTQPTAKHCSRECGLINRDRRKTRGVVLYDLFIEHMQVDTDDYSAWDSMVNAYERWMKEDAERAKRNAESNHQ